MQYEEIPTLRVAKDGAPGIVSNDNVVQWEGRRFQIPPQNRRFSFAGAKIQLYQDLDGRVSVYYGDTRLEHTNASGG
ncbi:MAG TPA: hypothetical protein VHF01_05170 [Candidatus Acidoferrum sp.]|nr:hypothetical protein [Candidatus Acidoferrum sp.]